MLANIGVGAILYTSYLQTLGALHAPTSPSLQRIYLPPPVYATFLAGSSAGAIQSVVAAPLDALSVRFRTREILSGKHKTMWHYGRSKLREIGLRGIFAGWRLNCCKDSISYGTFFATFEYVKANVYCHFLTFVYGDIRARPFRPVLNAEVNSTETFDTMKPHYAIEPIFLMMAGIAATFAQQSIQHPLSLIQDIHFKTLAHLEEQTKISQSRAAMPGDHPSTYRRTYERCLVYARRAGSWRHWLYQGFWWNTLKQVPSTSAGLVIFELVRRKYDDETDAVKSEKDRHDRVLS